MAKSKGIQTFSGKLDDMVFVQSSKYGNHVRRAPQPKAKVVKSPEFLAQERKTKLLNRLASAVHRVADVYAKNFRPGQFYNQVHARMRERKSDHPFVLLEWLHGVEINTAYEFRRYRFEPKFDIVKSGQALTVQLRLEDHADSETTFNSYYLEAIVLMWNTENDDYVHDAKKTAWISTKDPLPLGCTFEFPRAANAGDFLLMCRVHTGVNKKAPYLYFPDQGMKVITAGSFDESSLQALKDYFADRKAEEDALHTEHARPAVEEERVAMKPL